MSEDIVFTNLTNNIIQVCKERGFLRGVLLRGSGILTGYMQTKADSS